MLKVLKYLEDRQTNDLLAVRFQPESNLPRPGAQATAKRWYACRAALLAIRGHTAPPASDQDGSTPTTTPLHSQHSKAP